MQEKCSKTIYEQNCQDFRSLNEIMWRVPILAMSLTGGLGVAIATFDLSNPARQALLIFAGSANVIFICVLFRLRSIMDRLLAGIHSYEGTDHKGGFIVVSMFTIMLIFGALGSFGIASRINIVFPSKTEGRLTCTHGTANIRLMERLEQNRILLEVVCSSPSVSPTVQRHLLQRAP